MAQSTKAEIFTSGESQAVRIPEEFRFADGEVYIRRDERNGDLILSKRRRSMREILEALDELDIPEDFLSPAERASAQIHQEREEF